MQTGSARDRRGRPQAAPLQRLRDAGYVTMSVTWTVAV